jgi:hypothetical protein
LVELESIGGDQRGNFEIHSVGEVSKEDQRVAIASFADHGRRPKPRPDIHPNENPDRLLLVPDDRSDLIGLKLRNGKSP